MTRPYDLASMSGRVQARCREVPHCPPSRNGGAADHGSELGVVPGEVVEGLHGAATSERGVGAMVVVGVDPSGERVKSGLVAGVDAGVGPLQVDGVVESLDLAVGLRPLRPGPQVTNPGPLQGLPHPGREGDRGLGDGRERLRR